MLPLTIAVSRTDRTAALLDGRIRPEGLDVTWLPLNVEQIFFRMMRYREFDASEMSFSGYVVRKARGLDDFVAIPIFLSRSFRHSMVYINAKAGIERPEDLAGRRIGVPEYQMTAAVWMRGILEDDHGVRAQDIEWVQGGLEQPGRRPFEPVEPPGIKLSFARKDGTLAQMLADGEIDALLSPRVPSTHDQPDGLVRRLWTDTWGVQRDYFRRTRLFPIMHIVAVKRELVDKNPWIPQTLANAFTAAKRLAEADLRDTTTLPITLPFLGQHVEETIELMGEDYWPYGVEPNRATLEAFLRYSQHQGLIETVPAVDDLFPPSTRVISRI